MFCNLRSNGSTLLYCTIRTLRLNPQIKTSPISNSKPVVDKIDFDAFGQSFDMNFENLNNLLNNWVGSRDKASKSISTQTHDGYLQEFDESNDIGSNLLLDEVSQLYSTNGSHPLPNTEEFSLEDLNNKLIMDTLGYYASRNSDSEFEEFVQLGRNVEENFLQKIRKHLSNSVTVRKVNIKEDYENKNLVNLNPNYDLLTQAESRELFLHPIFSEMLNIRESNKILSQKFQETVQAHNKPTSNLCQHKSVPSQRDENDNSFKVSDLMKKVVGLKHQKLQMENENRELHIQVEKIRRQSSISKTKSKSNQKTLAYLSSINKVIDSELSAKQSLLHTLDKQLNTYKGQAASYENLLKLRSSSSRRKYGERTVSSRKNGAEEKALEMEINELNNSYKNSKQFCTSLRKENAKLTRAVHQLVNNYDGAH